jgi:hypothetical protein
MRHEMLIEQTSASGIHNHFLPPAITDDRKNAEQHS